MHPILFHVPLPHFGNVPIYSYGVMLAISLIVGWFLTLGLAERDGLPKEAMANCYVDTAVLALIGSRVLYVVTNPADFTSFASLFAMRSGGLVAYGGFLGGLVGSFLSLHYGFGLTGLVRFVANRFGDDGRGPWAPLPLLPWADVAVPSLAVGLGITRIGCYLFGCDYGKPLSDGAPAILKRLGTFPHWAAGTMTDGSSGSPAYDHHVSLHLISPDAATSLPVHPTQLYESLLGLSLLAFLTVMRKNQRFRGEIFLWFTFLYGTARFLLELVRDDTERGNIPPSLAPHVLIPLCVGLLGLGYAFGVAPRIGSPLLRMVSQAVALVPPVWLFVATRPAEFETVAPIQLSTSQFVGLASGLAACAGFWVLNRAALDHPDLAMALPDFSAHTDQPAEDELSGDEEEERRPRPHGPKKAPKKLETNPASTTEAADEAVGEPTNELGEPATEALEDPAGVATERPRTEAEQNPAPKKQRPRTEKPQGGP